ncbi:heavy metal translocating P-type ATPase [Aestuariivirga sp.]|uniref:heavy metal translocating P-type ATPase n=1 Tax=Aestuariivirga sp. TaxID=2650926 RepID=UPI0039E2E66E
MSCCVGSAVGETAAGAAQVQPLQRLNDLKAGSRALADGATLYTLTVPAIHCGQCITTIESALADVPGVVSARANLSLRRVLVKLGASAESPEAVVEALDELGYPPMAAIEDDGRADAEFKSLVRALAVAGFAAANIMLLSVSVWSGSDGATRDVFHYLSALIAIPTVAYAGRPFFRSAASALAHRRMNMDVPISLGVLLATGMSLYETLKGGHHAYFDAAVSLLFFLLIGRTLDQLMRAKARDAVGRLARLAAKGAMVIADDGTTAYQPVDQIAPGMMVRVAAGERLPVDGIVAEGESDVDRSLVTGESEPVAVRAGASLEAGTLNLSGVLDLRATRKSDQSFLAEVMQMMQAAETGRSAYVRMADRMARLYAPMVHVMALAAFLFWMVWTWGDWHVSLTVAISVLIITCPCALGLAVPVAHVVAASRLFASGVLMKDGSALERLADIDHAVFDKTGTLTGPVASIHTNTIPKGRLSAIAKALALRSIHPAARSLAASLDGAPAEGLAYLHEVPGHGVEAVSDGSRVRLGRKAWVAEIVSGAVADIGSGLGFAMDGTPLFSVDLKETLRPGVRETVQRFRAAGIESEILSGDAREAVSRVADAAGITSFTAGVKPGEKLHHLQEIATEGHRALMVGDGLNDAPALAAAHVSMAPAGASDIGRMAADFVFTRDDLLPVWHAHVIATRARRIVKENFALAIVYNAIAVPLALAGLMSPFIAALAMSSSSILVVGNSLRLRLIRSPAAASAPALPDEAVQQPLKAAA